MHLNPSLPSDWQRLEFCVDWRGSRLRVEVLPEGVNLEALEAERPMELMVNGSCVRVDGQLEVAA